MLEASIENVVIGSKAMPRSAGLFEELSAACEKSLRYLKRDYIDVYHLHWPGRDVLIDDIIDRFGKLRQSGKIRCFAVSNFGAGDLDNLLRQRRCEVDQLPYSLIWKDIALTYCRYAAGMMSA